MAIRQEPLQREKETERRRWERRALGSDRNVGEASSADRITSLHNAHTPIL